MSEPNTTNLRDLSPPGEILEEALEERGMKNAELARCSGLSEKHVSQLINAKVSLSLDIALRLERVLGIPAQLWLNMETRYRSQEKRAEQRGRLKGYADWMRSFPISEMRKAGYFGAAIVGRDVESRVEALLDFFGVTSPAAWEKEWEHATARFRKSPSFDPDRSALIAWLRRGEREAQGIRCSPFSEARWREVLQEARAMTREKPQQFQPRLVRLCAEAGVALTFVPALPKLAISGVTRWLGSNKAIISLSLRHKSDDQLWFSFFHEACHVLEHRTGRIYIDAAGQSDGDPQEQRADQFARDSLIPPEAYDIFTEDGCPPLPQIKRFAQKIGISPGIVVGRLQHDRLLPRTHGNKLKQWFQWDFES